MGEVFDGDRPDRPRTAQPAPLPGRGPSLHDAVIDAARHAGYLALAKIQARRKRFGLIKYGTILQAWNGRDPMVDAMEELADALVYLQQARVEERPGAEKHYQATLALAGSLAHRMPTELVNDPS